MIPAITHPNILFLPGTRRSDYMSPEKQVEKRALETFEVDDVPVRVEYDKIPRYFSDLATWQKTTNLRCWWCTLQFSSLPLFMPERFYEADGHQRIDVVGVFCSFPCLVGHVYQLHKADKTRRQQAVSHVKRLFKIITGKTMYYMDPAPDKAKLNIYGGPMNIDEYVSELRKMENMFSNAIVPTDLDGRAPLNVM